MMIDFDDVFIRQALKNWAANQNLPGHGRSRLLLMARSLDSIGQLDSNELICQGARNQFKHLKNRSQKYSNSERINDPINQTRFWLLHFSPFLVNNLA